MQNNGCHIDCYNCFLLTGYYGNPTEMLEDKAFWFKLNLSPSPLLLFYWKGFVSNIPLIYLSTHPFSTVFSFFNLGLGVLAPIVDNDSL